MQLGRAIPDQRTHENVRLNTSCRTLIYSIMANELNGIRVAILATNGFEQIELTEPRDALEAAGATTQVVSPEEGTIRGWDSTDWGDDVEVERTVDAAFIDQYDALMLPGGVLNPDKLRLDKTAVTFIRDFFKSGKPVAAICHAPQLLIEADVVRGHRITSYASIKTDLQNAGAEWVDEEVVVDGNLITSRNPGDIPVFSETMIKEFARTPAAA